jgi:hypothetical protein
MGRASHVTLTAAAVILWCVTVTDNRSRLTRRSRDRVLGTGTAASTTETLQPPLCTTSDDPFSSENLLSVLRRHLSSSIALLQGVECHAATFANVNVHTIRTGGFNLQKLLICSVRPRNT